VKGCLALLVLMVLLGVGIHAALLFTPMAGSWGLAVLVAVLVTFVLGNVWGVGLGLQRRLALKPPGQWQDGDFVAFSGRITAGDAALEAPASGARCPIYEYKLQRTRSQRTRTTSGTSGSSTTTTAFDGMAMAPTTVVGEGFGVRLVGFPLLTSVPNQVYDDPDSLRRFAGYLLRAEIEPKPESVRGALRQLGEILADEDGIVHHDQAAASAFDLDPFRAPALPPELAEIPELARAAEEEGSPEGRLVEHLFDHDFSVEETVVPEGAEVTVFGTYRASDRALDVGSGLSNIKHGLELGSAGRVTAGGIAKSLAFLLVFGGALGLLLWWLAPALAPAFSSERYQGKPVHLHELLAGRVFGSKAHELIRDLEGSPGEEQSLGLALRLGIDPDAANDSGERPLHRAATNARIDRVRLLLENGARVDAADLEGRTALHFAASRRDAEIAAALLEAGADPNPRDFAGRTPLDEAIEAGAEEVAAALRARGGQPGRPNAGGQADG
jgi:hypothetical protein